MILVNSISRLKDLRGLPCQSFHRFRKMLFTSVDKESKPSDLFFSLKERYFKFKWKEIHQVFFYIVGMVPI